MPYHMTLEQAALVEPTEDDVIGAIMEGTNGDGVDVALECAGV